MADAIALIRQDNTGGNNAGDFQNKSFRSMFDILPFQFQFEIDTALSDASGTGAAMEVAVQFTLPGVALGDFVFVTPRIDPADLSFVAYATAANTITVQIENLTGADLATFALNGGQVFSGFVLRLKSVVFDTLQNTTD